MILPASKEIKLNFSKEKIWDLISSPRHLELVHPFCKSNKIIRWDDKGHKDILLYNNNRTYIRNFYEWKINEGYKLMIGEKGKDKSRVIWEIKEDNQTSTLKISVYPYIFSNKPAVIYLFYYIFFINPSLRSYLHNVLKGIDWYLNNNTPVKKNQFGIHKWFSK